MKPGRAALALALCVLAALAQDPLWMNSDPTLFCSGYFAEKSLVGKIQCLMLTWYVQAGCNATFPEPISYLMMPSAANPVSVFSAFARSCPTTAPAMGTATYPATATPTATADLQLFNVWQYAHNFWSSNLLCLDPVPDPDLWIEGATDASGLVSQMTSAMAKYHTAPAGATQTVCFTAGGP